MGAEKKDIFLNHYEHVGPGWWPLLQALNDLIQYEFRQLPEAELKIEQIKEKFGALRIYFSFPKPEIIGPELREKITSLVMLAEMISGHICEQCGKKATNPPQDSPKLMWIKTLCEDHHTERNERVAAGGPAYFPRQYPEIIAEDGDEEEEC